MLRRYLVVLVCLPLLLATGWAETPGRVIEDIWESAYLDGNRAGSLHTLVREQGEGADRRLQSSAQLELVLRRHDALVRLQSEQGTEETPDGKVLGVSLRQLQARGQPLVVTGVVEDGKLHVRGANGRIDRRLGWNEEAIGLYRLQHYFAEKKPQPGDNWSFYRYEPVLTTLVTMQVQVKDSEEVPELPGHPARHLLRVEMRMEPVKTPTVTVQLPGEVWWLDEHFVAVRRQLELEGLGALTLVRSSRLQASAQVPMAQRADIGARTLLTLDRPIRQPYFTRTAVYRITIRGDGDPATALAQDSHQTAHTVAPNTIELAVHPVQPASAKGTVAEEKPPECLASCHYIDCDDDQVQLLARQAVGTETDPWHKARRIERYVKQRMHPDNGAPLVPASEVARGLRGDCRLYAFLTAALCRAQGIPARTAVGLLYVERGGRPAMGFHMWTEVWIERQWLGLDGTLGLGRASATHIKIADHSWYKVQSLTPLLPVQRVLGKIQIEVVEVDGQG